MRTSRSRWLALVPLLMLTASACGQQAGADGAGDSGAAEMSYSADTLVFRMDHVGGFVTPAMRAARLPSVSVYGDGRVITEGPLTLAYPGPALPNLQLGTISAGDVEKLVELARAAGVGTVSDLGTPPVADVPSTRFTVFGVDGVAELEVDALMVPAGDDPAAEQGLTADQRTAREKLREFAESLTSDSGPLAAAHAGAQAYAPTAVAAVAEPWVANTEFGEPSEVSWPGPALPGADLGKDLGVGCVTVTGDQARELLTAAASANALTPWVSDGKRWMVTLRPLLPDETDCTDLANSR
ncbi:hypothetical protein [Micromonospora qiuiae]|nr:hypothetical protein [Micromonospora qiuiae]